ncbi:hypothetical protein ACEU07_20915 [Chromobacterium violaceum]|uniref:hypothetical protein n=1 Tax=Chromobacterium violaceum TaxID=536 RepID=UPI0035A6CE49
MEGRSLSAADQIEFYRSLVYEDIQALIEDLKPIAKALGDIENNLPAAADKATDNIRKETERLELALKNLQLGMNEVAVQIDKRTAFFMENARTKAENRLNEFSDGLAQELVKTLDGIAEDIFATVEAFKSSQNDHQQAANNVIQSISRLETSVKQMLVEANKAVRSSNPSWEEKRKEFILLGLGSGLIAGICSALIVGLLIK